MKGGIFTGPQIRQMLGSRESEDKMTALERDAWQSFRNVNHDFLERDKPDNYEHSLETLLQIYCKLGSRMSQKMHHLHFHLDFFRLNLTALSEELGEQFQQDIQVMKKRYQGRWDEGMMGDYGP